MNRSIPVLLTFSFVIILFNSCQRGIKSDFERTVVIINDQQFEILTAWEILDEYVATKPDYEKNIFNKIKTEFNHGMEYPFLLEAIKAEIEPNDDLREVLEMMKGVDFVSIVDSTYQIVTKELHGPDTKILFIPANPAYREAYRQIGIGFHAFTLGSGRIIVSFDPTFGNWRQFIPYALAHEYHHSVWTSRNFETKDLTPLEYLMLEGKADSFARKLCPDIDHPFTNMLDEHTEKKIWKLIKPSLNERNTDTNDMLYYGTEDIPYGSVYSLGFSIVDSFRHNNPSINDRELIDLAPNEILKGSRFYYY